MTDICIYLEVTHTNCATTVNISYSLLTKLPNKINQETKRAKNTN